VLTRLCFRNLPSTTFTQLDARLVRRQIDSFREIDGSKGDVKNRAELSRESRLRTEFDGSLRSFIVIDPGKLETVELRWE
jgi:hypothetical protein